MGYVDNFMQDYCNCNTHYTTKSGFTLSRTFFWLRGQAILRISHLTFKFSSCLWLTHLHLLYLLFFFLLIWHTFPLIHTTFNFHWKKSHTNRSHPQYLYKISTVSSSIFFKCNVYRYFVALRRRAYFKYIAYQKRTGRPPPITINKWRSGHLSSGAHGSLHLTLIRLISFQTSGGAHRTFAILLCMICTPFGTVFLLPQKHNAIIIIVIIVAKNKAVKLKQTVKRQMNPKYCCVARIAQYVVNGVLFAVELIKTSDSLPWL